MKERFRQYYNKLTSHQKKIFRLLVEGEVEMIIGLGFKTVLKYSDGRTQRIRKDTTLKILAPELKYIYRDLL